MTGGLETRSRVLFVGGATGGHWSPAVAVARALAAYGVGSRFAITGREVERRVIGDAAPGSGWEIEEVPALGARGGLLSPSAWRRLRALSRESEAVVVLGGAPSFLASVVGKPRPIFALEQNRIIGRALRYAGRRLSRVALSYEDTVGPDALIRRRAVRVGCPVRAEFRPADVPETGPILVLGGSQGAHSVNELVPAALEMLSADDRAKCGGIVHIAGPSKSAGLADRYRTLGVDAEVHEFSNDVASEIRRCRFAIARAGGSTVAELAAVGRATIFVPYPHHTDRQQYRNAEWFTDANAGRIAEDVEAMSMSIRDFVHNGREVETAGANARAIGRPDAAEQVARMIATHVEKLPPSVAGMASRGVGSLGEESRS